MCNVQPRLSCPLHTGSQAKHPPIRVEISPPISFLQAGNYLPLLHLGRDRRIQLGEALAQARLRRHGLGDAPADAARLAARERLGGEVVDAGVETVVDQVAEDVHEVLDLALLEAGLELAGLGCCQAGGGVSIGLVCWVGLKVERKWN